MHLSEKQYFNPLEQPAERAGAAGIGEEVDTTKRQSPASPSDIRLSNMLQAWPGSLINDKPQVEFYCAQLGQMASVHFNVLKLSPLSNHSLLDGWLQ